MAKKVQLMTNPKQWQVVDGVEVLVNVPQEDLDPITDSSCVEIEGHRTLEETINQENMFTPEVVETKVHSKVGGVYHDNVVDGAYEEAILYGNTQVNLVESMTSDSKYIPHSFTSFQGNERKIGIYHSGRTNQVAPLVKGVTMVNLCQESSMTLTSGAASSVYNIKGGTEYTLKFTFTQKNSMAGIVIQSYKDENGTLTYLENSKLQSGLGDEVAITFTTHEQANRVHIYNGNEYGGETIQLDNIMVIEGDVTDLDLPFFKGMRSVELSRPLTNLFANDYLQIYDSNTTSTVSNGNITVTSTSVNIWTSTSIYFKDLLKPNTKYLVMWDSLTATQTATGEAIINTYAFTSNTDLKTSDSDIITPTLRSYVFDTGNFDVNDIVVRIHATTSNSETGITTVTGLRVFEWDDSLRTLDLQTIGYFSGTKYVSAPKTLETEGKNLYPYGDINFTNDYVGWCDVKGKTNMYGDIAQKSSCRFLLKKGTYTFNFGETVNTTYLALVDDKEQSHGSSVSGERTFTLSQDTYMTLRLKTTEANVATTVTNIQIERGETATEYEAYQSRYYKPRETEEIILRSLPNGVCDTFNLQTGELVRNIGEIVVDGSGDYVEHIHSSSTHYGFRVPVTLKPKTLSYEVHTMPIICDRLPSIDYTSYFYGVAEGVSIFRGENSTLSSVYISFDRNRINMPQENNSINHVKEYCKTNPLTVQYELAEPIITKLQTYNRVYNGQTNGIISMSNNLSALTYYSNNYYLKVGNLSPVPAILEPITTIPYNVRLKPSTLYTIKYNRGGYSSSMKFDLGGSVVEKTNSIASVGSIAEEFTVRTPIILSHDQLILSGTGYAYNFIVVEGDITGTELPYFEGMKDVKMPIVKNIGKNLFDIQSIYQALKNISPNNVLLLNDNTLQIKSRGIWHKKDLGKPIKFKKNTRYTLSFNAQDIDNIGGLVDTIICFVYTDGTTSFSRVWGDNVCISTAGKTVDYINFSFGLGDGRVGEFSNFMLVEGTEAQPYEPYKENSIYITQGEYPITSEMIEQGGFGFVFGDNYQEMKVDNTKRLRSVDLIPVKPSTTYVFCHSCGDLEYNIYQWDGNRIYISDTSQYLGNGDLVTMTTTADTQYIQFLMSKKNTDNEISADSYDWNNFHMYELDSTINLRSLPNGVKDELNLLTGEYIQRVGEVIIDGSQTLQSERPNHKRMYIVKDDMKKLQNYSTSMVCDKFNVSMGYSELSGTENTWVSGHTDTINQYPNRNWIYFNIENVEDVSSMTTYLQSNPITVQYELAEPIISYPRLVSNNQEREVGIKLPNGVCNTYNPSTGITTVRVGKVVLDGSEDWVLDTTKTNTQVFELNMVDMKLGINNNVICDSLPLSDRSGSDTEKIASTQTTEKDGRVIWGIYIALLKTKASTVDELKTYLASNPITVWYQLKYPQIQPDIVLPNGVHDEYNPETGVYTKKVGFIELDGSVDEKLDSIINNYNKENTVVFFAYQHTPLAKKYEHKGKGYPIYTNQFEYVDVDLGQTMSGGVSMDVEGAYMAFDCNVCFAISKEKLKPFGFTSDMNVKTQVLPIVSKYLSQNPLKVWYELQTPVTYQLTPYFGLPQPYAYEDGYLIHESAYAETTLPPEFKYKLVANRTGQVMQNNRKLQEHTTRLSNLEALIIEATIESLFNRELQLFELELMDIQLIDLGE